MKLIAIRHGETEWNVEGREMGQLDSPLTARGVEQSRLIAERLGQVLFDTLYSSDLGRALQTAEIIAAECGSQVRLDAGLRERHMGIFQGLTLAEMRERFPKERAHFEQMGPDYVVPGGESARQALERSAEVVTAIAQRHAHETVVVVTHGGFLMVFFQFVLGLPPGNGRRFKRYNASYNAFDYEDDKWSLVTWNDISHLSGLPSLDDRTVQTMGEKKVATPEKFPRS
jgi:broad specificity phosphatase PhoE